MREADGVASRIDPQLPLLVLSGRVGELHRLRGFERGADDVMGKPFGYAELRARDRRAAAPQRPHGAPRAPARRRARDRPGGAHRRARRPPRSSLSQKEFALLRTLASDPTRVFTKEELLRTLWGFRASGSTRTLDSHACRLRQKLARDGDRYLVNVWGVGYRLVDGPLGADPVAGAATAGADR